MPSLRAGCPPERLPSAAVDIQRGLATRLRPRSAHAAFFHAPHLRRRQGLDLAAGALRPLALASLRRRALLRLLSGRSRHRRLRLPRPHQSTRDRADDFCDVPRLRPRRFRRDAAHHERRRRLDSRRPRRLPPLPSAPPRLLPRAGQTRCSRLPRCRRLRCVDGPRPRSAHRPSRSRPLDPRLSPRPRTPHPLPLPPLSRRRPHPPPRRPRPRRLLLARLRLLLPLSRPAAPRRPPLSVTSSRLVSSRLPGAGAWLGGIRERF
mmetsp:Transcript_7937/g.24383  ORF Transcript_7937/g.24383 Transcript_7937/m.24383 type:complete len:263 (-) Transcript_7937:3412-4200(-)